MIVDVLRNDLGRVCETGSVRVPELCALERFPQVWHLTSTVLGTLRAGLGPFELLNACFPGGSISGAPKIRAMELLETLEPVRRHLYTGAIGWIGWDGDADWSIAIRTAIATHRPPFLECGRRHHRRQRPRGRVARVAGQGGRNSHVARQVVGEISGSNEQCARHVRTARTTTGGELTAMSGATGSSNCAPPVVSCRRAAYTRRNVPSRAPPVLVLLAASAVRLALAARSSASPALAIRGCRHQHAPRGAEGAEPDVGRPIQAIVAGDDDSTRGAAHVPEVARVARPTTPAWSWCAASARRIHEGPHPVDDPWPHRVLVRRGPRRQRRTSSRRCSWRSVQPVRPLIATGPVFYVDQRLGDDALERQPARARLRDRTARAHDQRRARRARGLGERRPHGGVFVAPGEYHERTHARRSASDGDHHFSRATAANRDSTIVCGANPWVEQRHACARLARLVVGRCAATRPMSTPFLARLHRRLEPRRFDPADGHRLGRVPAPQDLASAQCSTTPPSTGSSPPPTRASCSGWFWQHDSLYVKRKNGHDPRRDQPLHAGYLDNLIDVQRRNWLHRQPDRALRRRPAAATPRIAPTPHPPLSGHGIVAGVSGIASGLVVEHRAASTATTPTPSSSCTARSGSMRTR